MEGVAPVLEPAPDVTDEMHDVRVALDHHELRHLDRADPGHAAHVVAAEIHEHHVLGTLLRIGLHFGRELFVLCFRPAARMRARDGPLLDTVVLEAHEHLGGGADDARLAQAQKEKIGGGIDGAKRPVDREGIRPELRVQPSRDHDLIGVTRSDVLLGLAHAFHVGRLVHGRGKALLAHGHERLDGGKGQGRRRPRGPRELGEQRLDPGRRLVISTVERGLVLARDVCIADHQQAVAEIVEDEQAVRKHEHGVRQLEVVLGPTGQCLHMADHVVREEADGPPLETRQSRHGDGLEAREERSERVEGIGLLELLDPSVSVAHREPTPLGREDH